MNVTGVALAIMGHTTCSLVIVVAMLMSYVAGIILNTSPRQKPYRMSEEELRRICNGLDDTSGFLIKTATLRYEIENAVNKDRGTTIEWNLQELRKGVEARTRTRTRQRRTDMKN